MKLIGRNKIPDPDSAGDWCRRKDSTYLLGQIGKRCIKLKGEVYP